MNKVRGLIASGVACEVSSFQALLKDFLIRDRVDPGHKMQQKKCRASPAFFLQLVVNQIRLKHSYVLKFTQVLFYYRCWQWDVTVLDNHFLALLGKNQFHEFLFQWCQWFVRVLVDVDVEET